MLHMAVLYEKLIEGCGRNAHLHTAGTDPLIIYSFIKKISSPGQHTLSYREYLPRGGDFL